MPGRSSRPRLTIGTPGTTEHAGGCTLFLGAPASRKAGILAADLTELNKGFPLLQLGFSLTSSFVPRAAELARWTAFPDRNKHAGTRDFVVAERVGFGLCQTLGIL